MKPRTVANIVEDLLEIIQEEVEFCWREIPCGRGCCSDSTNDCEWCGGESPNHKPDCKLGNLIKEAWGFVEVEREIKDMDWHLEPDEEAL